MPNSAVVGTLRALLQLNTSEYESSLKRSAASTKEFAKTAETQVAPALAKVEAQMQRTGAASQRMVSYLQGDKLLKSANDWVTAVNKVGGATKLTEQESARLNVTLQKAIDKYKQLGQTAPKAVLELEQATRRATSQVTTFDKSISGAGASMVRTFGAAFGITALAMGLKSMVSEAIRGAGALVDLSNKTGLSTTALQQMEYASGQAGGSLEGTADAAYKLGIRLAGGSASVRSAVKDLGLDFQTLKNQRPEDQFKSIATALGAVDSATERNRIGTELFGKSFTNVASIIAEGYAKLAGEAPVMADATVRALERAGDALDRLYAKMKILAGTIAAGLLPPEGRQEANDRYRDMTPGQRKMVDSLQGQGQGILLKDAIDMYDAIRDTARKLRAEHSEAGKSAQTYAEKVAAIQLQLSKLTEAEKKELDFALKLNTSQEELEDTFGLSAAAIAMYTQQQRAAATATKKTKEEVEKLQELLTNQIIRVDGTAGPATLSTQSPSIAALRGSSFVPGDQLAQAVSDAQHLADAEWNVWKSATERIEAKEKEKQDRIDALRQESAEREAARQQRFVEGWTNAIMAVGSVVAQGMQSGQSAGNTAFNATVTAVGMIPGYGSVAAMGLAIGKGIIDAQETRENRNVRAEQSFHTVMAGLSTSLGAGQTGTLMARVGAGLSDVYRDLGISAQQAQDDLVALHEASKESAEAYEEVLERINQNLQHQSDLTDARKQKQELLNQAVQRYGISWDEAGRLFQRGTLADQAETLIQDFKLLVESGADPSIIAQRMAGAASVFVQQAVKTGTEIPEAMRPMLREMASLGLLLDENGMAFHVEMLEFGNQLESMFDRVLEKLEALIDALTATKEGEISKGGGEGPILSKGGSVDLPGGKRFQIAHRGLYLGADEHPVIMQSGEAVLNRFAVAMLGGKQGIEALNGPGMMPDPYGAMQMGQAGISTPWMSGTTPTTTGWSGGSATEGPVSVNATIHVHGIQDPAEVSREVARRLPMEISRNTHGVRSKLRRQLGT